MGQNGRKEEEEALSRALHSSRRVCVCRGDLEGGKRGPLRLRCDSCQKIEEERGGCDEDWGGEAGSDGGAQEVMNGGGGGGGRGEGRKERNTYKSTKAPPRGEDFLNDHALIMSELPGHTCACVTATTTTTTMLMILSAVARTAMIRREGGRKGGSAVGAAAVSGRRARGNFG